MSRLNERKENRDVLAYLRLIVNPVDNLVIGRNDYPLPSGWAPSADRFDLINPGFFERIYRRCGPTAVGKPDTGSDG